MKFNILTLFPEMFDSLSHSILGRASAEGIIDIKAINIRGFSTNKHKKVDDYPYGGGPGMVMKFQPIDDAFKSLNTENARIIYLTPKGKVFNQSLANELAKEDNIIFLCGHYEGIDQRIIDKYITDEVSIGDYVLTGGEIPTMVMIDSISRLVDGVLSKNVSYEDESHYNGLLEHNHYTRPSECDGMVVPDILLSGNHKKIDEYRRKESLVITDDRRPDMINSLIRNKGLSKKDLEIIKSNRQIKNNLV